MSVPVEHPPQTITLTLPARIARADVPALCATLTDRAQDQVATAVICDVGRVGEPTMDTVEALARLRLTAGRLGLRMWLYRTSRRLRLLLEQIGLSRILPEHPDEATGESTRSVDPGGADHERGEDLSAFRSRHRRRERAAGTEVRRKPRFGRPAAHRQLST